MLKERTSEINKKTVVFSALLFSAFAMLVYLFPYSGDDWSWGSYVGLDHLANAFDNYNGRYAGNLLVICLTRSELLNVIITAISCVLACFLPKFITKAKGLLPYVFATFLFFIIPKEILAQSIVWTSGFSNYVPPIILSLVYFAIIRNIFDDEKPKYSIYLPFLTAIIGFISSLFMENITLYNIAIAALITFFVLIKFKKVYFAHIAYFVGNVIGAIVMFSNSSYASITSGTDSYRSTALTDGLKDVVFDNSFIIFKQLFRNNFLVLLILSLLCLGSYIVFANKNPSSRSKKFGLILLATNIFSLFVIYAKGQFSEWTFFTKEQYRYEVTVLVFAFFSALYFGTIILMTFLFVDNKNLKYKALLFLVSVPILIVPLVVVTPIGPRCFFPPYIMIISACVVLLVYLKKEFRISKTVNKTMSISLALACIALFVSLFSIYSVIHKYDVKRDYYIQKQMDAGAKTLVTCNLPFASYVWTGKLNDEVIVEKYKNFHGIDESYEVEVLDYKEFDKWVETYE